MPGALVVQLRGLRDDADFAHGARGFANRVHFQDDFEVFLRRAPRRSDDGFPRMRPGREFEILKGIHGLRDLFRDSGETVSHVLAWQICINARLLVPLPLNRKVRRLLGLIVLLDSGASQNRIDEELKELFLSLLPRRCGNAELLKALDGIPRHIA
jgi:hypothetical protein